MLVFGQSRRLTCTSRPRTAPQGSTTGEDYTGGRDAEGIVKYVNEKTGLNRKVKKTPSAVVDLTPANFDAVVNGDKHVFLEFYAPWWCVFFGLVLSARFMQLAYRPPCVGIASPHKEPHPQWM